MDKKVKFIASTLLVGSVFSAGSQTSVNAATHQEVEKCWGVVKPGMNDCGSKAEGHSCAGSGVNPMHNWIYMPKGFCEKLVNGRLKAELRENGGDHHDGDGH